MSTRRLMQATQSFSIMIGGVPLTVGKGDLYFDDDPAFKAAPINFADVEVKSSAVGRTRVPVFSSGAEETASADPGLKRRVGRPPKSVEPSEV